MIELKTNIFSLNKPNLLRCITTNGVIKKNGELVMGAGVAKAAALKYPRLPRILGDLVNSHGNNVFLVKQFAVASFPTKHHWVEKSSLELIERSCKQLLDISDDWEYIALPRPGCSNGGLDWSEVKPIVDRYLSSDKFIVVHL